MIKDEIELKTIIEKYVDFILECGEYEHKAKLRRIVTGNGTDKISQICDIVQEITDKGII